MTGIAADIPEVGKCRKYGQKCGWDVAGRQGSDSKVHKTDERLILRFTKIPLIRLKSECDSDGSGKDLKIQKGSRAPCENRAVRGLFMSESAYDIRNSILRAYIRRGTT